MPGQRRDGSAHPLVSQIDLTSNPVLVTPMCSLEVTSNSNGHNYVLKVFFDDASEMLDERTLASVVEFDQAFYERFPRPEKGLRASKPTTSAKRASEEDVA